jgi:hypothetical protein
MKNEFEHYYKVSDKFKRLMKDILIDKVEIDEKIISSYHIVSNKILEQLNSHNKDTSEELKELLEEYNKIFNLITIQYKLLQNENHK